MRVSRGHQIKNGPQSGYRYDGLYYVESYERIIGQRGFYICRFHLQSEDSINQLENKLKPSLKSSYERTIRATSTISRLKRNVKISENIKTLYDYKCQVCGVRLNSPSGPIAIGAHIKGLGQPHNGPDAIENMLCLCPNHYDQFDYYSYYIESDNFEIIGLEDFKSKKLNIHPRHKIDIEFLNYHKKKYFENNSLK